MRLTLLVASISVFASISTAAPTYTATQLGNFGGTVTAGNAINAAGDIVGFSFLPGNASLRAFLWSGGPLINLGTLGTLGLLSEAVGVNDQQQVVGLAYPDPNFSRAFRYSGGSMMDLGTLGGASSRAYGINGAGQIVGASEVTPGSSDVRAFVWAAGSMTDLGTLGGRQSYGRGINASGQIAGEAQLASGAWRAFRYSGGAMHDLGVPGLSSGAYAINAAGQIAGSLQIALGSGLVSHAFLYTNGTTVDLDPQGLRNSNSLGLNDGGTVTGWSCDLNDACVAFVYLGGAMYDLNTLIAPPLSGIVLSLATAINNAGQIVAGGCTVAQPTMCYTYRLDPSPPMITVSAPSPFVATVGAHGSPQTLSLVVAPGAHAFTVTGIAATGEFMQTNTCGASVPSGGACAISVTFAPTIAGTRTGTLAITGNQVGSPTVIALQGSGLPVVTEVPTLSAWCLFTLAAALAMFGGSLARRDRRR